MSPLLRIVPFCLTIAVLSWNCQLICINCDFLLIFILNPTIVCFSQKCDFYNSHFDIISCSYDFLAVATFYFTVMTLSRNCDFICINCDFLLISSSNLTIVTFFFCKAHSLTNLALMTFSQLQLLRIATL